MAKSSKTKTAKKRVKVGKLSTTKTKLTGRDMKQVKGGILGHEDRGMASVGGGVGGVSESLSLNVVAPKKPTGTP